MEIHCPHCQIKLEMEDGVTGHEVACPACHGVFVVPAAVPIKKGAAQTPPAPVSSQAAPQKAGAPPADYKLRSGGGGFFKFVLLVILLALLAFGIACYQSNQPPQVVYQRLVDAVIQEVSPPAPLQKPAAPPPVVVAVPPKPSPPPRIVVAPPPPSEPDPIAWIQEKAQESTVEITLLADTTFPIIYNGKVAGSGNLPAPNTVRLVKVDPEGGKVTVSYPGYGNGTTTVPIDSTDLLEQAQTGLEKAEADAQAEAARKLPAAAAPSSPPSSLSNAVPQPAAVAETTNAAPQQTEPGASTNTAPAEAATLSPSPFGSTGEGSTIPELAPKVLPPGEKSPLITSFTPTVHEVRNATSGLLHPGIFQTKEQLDTMQRHVRNGDQPWASAFEAFSQLRNCSTDPRIFYGGWTEITHSGLNQGGNLVTVRMAKDANTAYKQVVMWYITGDETYRLNALKIIRDYCAIKTVAPHWDSQIRWGVASYQMCCAAEVLRYSDGNTDASRWTDDDTAQFSTLMKAGEGLVAGTGYWMNQHGFSTMGEMGTAIFLDDKALYEEAVERTTVNSRGQQGGRNGSIEWQMRLVTENFETHEKVTPQVQLVEMIRDQPHAWDDVAVLSTCCQTIYNQGTKVDPVAGTVSTAANAVDVFGFLDNRFLAGVDYITRYTLGEPVTWIPIDMGDHIKGAPGGFYDLGILYNHYKYIEKWSTQDPRFHAVAEAYESLTPEPDAVDVPCEGTLLLTPDNAAAPQQTEPGASTNAAPTESATSNASPFGTMEGGPTSLGPRTFIHPGIPLTKEDLDEVKRNLGREPWKSAFEALKSDPEASLDRKMYGPFDTVCRTPNINLTPWKRDMNAVYKLSLLWYLTGDEAYAQKAHDVLMAYVKNQKSFGGVEMYLSLGDYADTVLGGADILRGTWPGWTADDTTLCKAYFRNLYAGTINEGAWSIGPLRSANQGALQLINYVCVSVFLDDSEMFNNCVRMFLADPETGLTDTLPNGELGDTGRDQGHAAGELVRTLLAAEVFWKQGVDVYSARDHRLLAMGEFYARYNLNYPTPFMPFGTKYTLFRILPPLPGPGKPSTTIASMIYKAYTIRMGLSAPYSTQAMDAVPFDAYTFLYYKIGDHSTARPPPPMPEPAPTEPLTDNLDNVEIGDASPGGSGAYAGGTWTIQGAGTAEMLNPPWGKWVWRGDDSCHFAYRKVTGDATLIARVTSVEEVQDFTMAGLMIRDSLQPKAARMAVWSTPNAREKGPSVETDLRGFSHSSHDSPFQIHENGVIPYWLKLERVGDRITCWNSPDGASWTPIEDGLFPAMGQTAYLGLFVCSTMNGKTATATFDNVRMTGGGGVEQVKTPAAPFAVYGGPGDGQVPLRWLESFGATSYNVKRSGAKGGPYETIASVRGTSLVDTAVKNGETYYYVVSATNSAGESPNSLEDSVTPQVRENISSVVPPK